MTEGKIRVLSLGPETFKLSLEEYKKPRLLYCMNEGYFLRILPGGAVEGNRDRNDKYNVLQIRAERVGVVSIKGTEAGQYLAMNTNGALYGSSLTDECLFFETIEENHHNTYRSQKYQDRNWYVGIKKNGRTKAGAKTHIGQKAVCFLPLPVDDN